MAIIACLLWSTAFTGVKIGLNYMSPLLFAGVRFFISGILILLYYGKFKAYFQAIKTHFGYILLIAFLQTVLMYGLFYRHEYGAGRNGCHGKRLGSLVRSHCGSFVY